jgi:hypothetical protein
MAEVRRKVARADKEAIHSIDRGYCLDLFERRPALQLNQHTSIQMSVLMIVADAAVIVGARRHGDSANAKRWVASSGYGYPGFLGVLDEGDDQGTSPNVEDPFDHNRIIPRHANNRFGSASAHRLKLCNNGRYIIGSVFTVENNPVEPGTGDNLGCDVAAQTAPKPNLSPAF